MPLVRKRQLATTEPASAAIDWEVARLGDATNLIMGQSPPSETYNGVGLGLPFLQGKAEFGDVYPTPLKWCSNPLKVAPQGSVLVSVRAPVGDVNLAPRDLCIGRGLAAIQPNDQIDGEFLFYSLKKAKSRLESHGTGTTFQSINKSVLERFSISLPPLPEQRAIAHVLRTVQQAKGATEKVIAATRQLKQSLMKHLFTYGPVPFDQADKVELKETEIGLIPKHWSVERLDTHWSSMLGKMLSPNARMGKSPRPYLRNANVQWGHVDLTDLLEMDFDDKDYDRYGLIPGDVLICEGGEVGRTALWKGELRECYYQKALHRLRPRTHQMTPEFLLYHMMQAFLISRCYGEVGTVTTIAHLPGIKLKALPIPVPTLAEQNEIVSLLNGIDKKIAAEEGYLRTLNSIFDSLLHHIMTGKVRVPLENNESVAEAI